MKKILALVMALALCLTAAAEYTYETHTANCGLYSFELPAGGMVLSGETIAAIVGEEALRGQMTLSDDVSLSDIDLSRVEFVSGTDFPGFFLVSVDINVPRDASPVAILKAMIESYEKNGAAPDEDGVTVSFVDGIALGENTWYGMEASAPGAQMQLFFAGDAAGYVYSVVFYDVPSDVVAHILETFIFLG